MNARKQQDEPRYIVRYGLMRLVAEFTTRVQRPLPRGAQVLVRTDRGIEWGEVLCPATDAARQYLGSRDPKGYIIREATRSDHDAIDNIRRHEWEEFHGCQQLIAARKLQMQLVDVEHLFGGERIIFYFLAEKRVDFRELVRALARIYNTRIEMRQIGIRDEARLLADYGDCGKPVCCNTHLREMPPVSMKMAKIQKASLDPAKLSGRCGRLKCCLRYEYETYEAARRALPKVGAVVVTREGQGRVVDQQLLAEQVVVALESGKRVTVKLPDIITVVSSSSNKNGKKARKKAKSGSDSGPAAQPTDVQSAKRDDTSQPDA
ncbi:MAG: signal peptidase [Planctomycetota bacterium]|nr:MAG: signal peptidase [Planctomycetota bacterium]